MLKAIYGLYPDPDSAQRAVDSLRGAGIEQRDLAVMSSEPFEEFEFGRIDHRTRMPWLAVLGGLLGGATGFLLSSLTQKLYPLPTGGMPIMPFWSNGIVTYELTMLGAILMTLLTLLFTARLPDWRGRLYDPEITEGRILVGVVNPAEESRVELQRRLREAGALQVKDFGPASDSGANPETEGRSS
jgi:hypothetical protein